MNWKQFEGNGLECFIEYKDNLVYRSSICTLAGKTIYINENIRNRFDIEYLLKKNGFSFVTESS